tara:strand:+ start:549 stop:1205 length:657 start_codon:yes stop_codon:yes gene_type:complete
MIKIIPDFLPNPLFRYLKQIVESEKGMLWCWNHRNLAPQNKAVGAENYKLGKTLYCAPELEANHIENYDKELMPLFGVFQLYMMEHMQDRCKTPEDAVVLKRMKMNLYPNQETQVDHGIHNDIWIDGRARPDIVTAVFNFTTCNGSTTIFDKDEEGKYTKKIVVPSLENTIVMFNNTHPHFGTTQSDTPARIVLNINLAKAPINNLNNENFEAIDDYF